MDFTNRLTAVLVFTASSSMKREEHVVCTDEKTGIQAPEHARPEKPMKPGYVERREQEHIRHGTTSLIASHDVKTGEVLSPMIRPTRDKNRSGFVGTCSIGGFP